MVSLIQWPWGPKHKTGQSRKNAPFVTESLQVCVCLDMIIHRSLCWDCCGVCSQVSTIVIIDSHTLWVNSALQPWRCARGWEEHKHPGCVLWLAAEHVWMAVFITASGHTKLAWLAEDWWIGKWGRVKAVAEVLVGFWASRCCSLSSVQDRWFF